MSQNLTISETGLKLIKAFEGYRPVDRELITGQRIVGYGHRLYSDEPVVMSKAEAETVLRSDLEPFEEMINTEVHAPMSQSQFDALCSFAYNIGPKAFLKSDTLRALNNGRPLDAANGLDIWRKSEIAGKTYVVDALMRRRTAEKALFLRTENDLPAGREDLPPIKDTTIIGLSTEDALPVFTEDDANGIVTTAPYAAKISPMRRREDGPAGALQLSELDIIEDSDAVAASGPAEEDPSEVASGSDLAPIEGDDLVSIGDLEADIDVEEMRSSPIAAAATDIVARLDALIEDADTRFEDRDADWPESLISAADVQEDDSDVIESDLNPSEYDLTDDEDVSDQDEVDENVIKLNARNSRSSEMEAVDANETEGITLQDKDTETEKVLVIDELAQDDAFRAPPDSAAKYIEKYAPETVEDVPENKAGSGLSIPVILGFILMGASAGAMVKGSEALLGSWGPIITFTGFVIGAGLILAGIYAVLRIKTRS